MPLSCSPFRICVTTQARNPLVLGGTSSCGAAKEASGTAGWAGGNAEEAVTLASGAPCRVDTDTLEGAQLDAKVAGPEDPSRAGRLRVGTDLA